MVPWLMALPTVAPMEVTVPEAVAVMTQSSSFSCSSSMASDVAPLSSCFLAAERLSWHWVTLFWAVS